MRRAERGEERAPNGPATGHSLAGRSAPLAANEKVRWGDLSSLVISCAQRARRPMSRTTARRHAQASADSRKAPRSGE